MRRVLGWVVFGTGLLGLGWLGQETQAARIQEDIATKAQASIGDTRHGISAEVSGRDVRLVGLAHDVDEKQAIMARLDQVTGLRVVHDDLDLLPVQQSYGFKATVMDGEIVNATGAAPDDDHKLGIETALNGVPSEIALAAGEPDFAWAQAVALGISAMDHVVEGDIAFVGNDVTVSGYVETESDLMAVFNALTSSPEGYVWAVGLTIGAPLSSDIGGRAPLDAGTAN